MGHEIKVCACLRYHQAVKIKSKYSRTFVKYARRPAMVDRVIVQRGACVAFWS